MLLFLNKYIRKNEIKEGIALFNTFTGNTHFLPHPLHKLIAFLAAEPCSEKALLDVFLSSFQKSLQEQENATKQFQQFITEALKSDIIIEIN